MLADPSGGGLVDTGYSPRSPLPPITDRASFDRVVSTRAPAVGSLAQSPDGALEIVVSDTGQGIAPGVLPVIFERFRQADSSSTRTHAGLGLGLALVKHLVELHGGSVVARSDGDARGATFIVKLPLAIA